MLTPEQKDFALYIYFEKGKYVEEEYLASMEGLVISGAVWGFPTDIVAEAGVLVNQGHIYSEAAT